MLRTTKFIIAVLMATGPSSLIAQVQVRGYFRKDGTFVAPHMRSAPNATTLDNWSTKGNFNPYTGKQGYKNPPPASLPLWPSYRYVPPASLPSLSVQQKPRPVEPSLQSSESPVSGKADPQFRALFNSWKRLDEEPQVLASIPSARPVASNVHLSREYKGQPHQGAEIHDGVDISGKFGTPVYAAGDGVIGSTGWVKSYGNLVQVEHGKGIQTRYGYLSSIIAQPGARVKRGQLIGLMGGAKGDRGFLHYEVRLDGQPVNPTPFLRTDGFLLSNREDDKKMVMTKISSAILEGRCDDAKRLALLQSDIDLADKAMRLCSVPSSAKTGD